MSVVGIDFGNLNTVIAVARNKGIDVICNDVSNRLTPSMVAFGSKSRYIGESAKSLEIGNMKNTIHSLKRLLGRAFNDPEVASMEKKYLNCELVPDDQGLVAVKVTSQMEEKTFTMVQIVSMFFSKLKEMTESALETARVSDVVIAVPVYYTDMQRRALIDAATIAGLNVLRLVNDTTASAIAYGIPKFDLPESKPKHVCLVDIGQSAYSVMIGAFTKGHLDIKGRAFDRNFGGRDFDEALTNYFVKEFSVKYKINIASSPKAVYRLRGVCEKAKKVLSANSKTNVSVECIMDDKDVSAELTRPMFEELCVSLLDRIEGLLQHALNEAGLTISDIDSIEIVGGSTRIPAIKERISAFFGGKELNSTLNQDEAVARGCAFQCAIISPSVKCKDFQVQELNPFGISLSWEPIPEEPEDKGLEIFPYKNVVPSTKLLTFSRQKDFEIEADYARPLYDGIQTHIGSYRVIQVPKKPDNTSSTIKVKVRLGPSGLLTMEGAQLIEEIEEPAPQPENPETPASAKPKKVKKTDLPMIQKTASLPENVIALYSQMEAELAANDKLVADTEHSKNALEEYIYEMRNKSDSELVEYITEKDKLRLLNELQKTEDWLYSEGWEATKSVYIEKLAHLKKYGNPVVELYKEHEALESAVRAFQETCSKLLATANNPQDEKTLHIPKEEKDSLIATIHSKHSWLNEQILALKGLPKHTKLPLASSSVKRELEQIVSSANAVLNKPKPAPPKAASSTPSSQPSTTTTTSEKETDPAFEHLNSPVPVPAAAVDPVMEMD